MRALEQISANLFRFRDTCHVYVVRTALRHQAPPNQSVPEATEAILIDFGSGDVLDLLDEIGVDGVSDVLMTHHHRDQGQGLARAVEAGARIWVPATERDLFSTVDSHWQSRTIENSYNNRQDRFSLLEPVEVAGTLDDYAVHRFGDLEMTVVPTPGHTTGSISLLTELDGRKACFSGDLIAGPGKLWSLAATQWSYNGAEGVASTLASVLDLEERRPEVLLPSHGETMDDPGEAIGLLAGRLRFLLDQRGQNQRLEEMREQPFRVLSPHLLCNRTAMAYHYVLLSDSGNALFIDFGYDFMMGAAAGSDRASRRPWLYTLPTLKRQFGVKRVEVVLPTHYHDDHVAGLNLLRRVEGAEVWAPGSFAPVLTDPARFDLPCLWYDPIAVDRALPLETPVRWREFELTLHHQPGHTTYAVAISFEVDGRKVLAVGDQFEGGVEARWNYVYNNGFHHDDYRGFAELLDRVRPDLLLAGHYLPHEVDEAFRANVRHRADLLSTIHRELLPLEDLDFGGGDRAVHLRPYRANVRMGERLFVTAEVCNPLGRRDTVFVRMVAPQGWLVVPEQQSIELEAGALASLGFTVQPCGPAVRRARLAADVTVGSTRLGQQAEALVSVEATGERAITDRPGREDSGRRPRKLHSVVQGE